jgi:hypothetical protein
VLDHLAAGLAWLPDNPLAWLDAATAGTGLTWEVTPTRTRILRLPAHDGATGYVVAEGAIPEECALTYLEARR